MEINEFNIESNILNARIIAQPKQQISGKKAWTRQYMLDIVISVKSYVTLTKGAATV